MLLQVKRDKPGDDVPKRRSAKTIEQMTKQQVLVQIGMELLNESSESYISPVVVGILCLRSEVMPYF